MTHRSTSPIDLEGGPEEFPAAWQADEIPWSFGPSEHRVVGWRQEPSSQTEIPTARNESEVATSGPQEVSSPKLKPVILHVRDFGKRGFSALSHWEGIVEEVKGDTFSSRLIPLAEQNGGMEKYEFTEFSFEDLAVEDDRALVQPGAVFYWTIGRARNEAGTMTNTSLVRFRRLPATTRTEQERAESEAEDLLSMFSPEDGLDASAT